MGELHTLQVESLRWEESMNIQQDQALALEDVRANLDVRTARSNENTASVAANTEAIVELHTRLQELPTLCSSLTTQADALAELQRRLEEALLGSQGVHGGGGDPDVCALDALAP